MKVDLQIYTNELSHHSVILFLLCGIKCTAVFKKTTVPWPLRWMNFQAWAIIFLKMPLVQCLRFIQDLFVFKKPCFYLRLEARKRLWVKISYTLNWTHQSKCVEFEENRSVSSWCMTLALKFNTFCLLDIGSHEDHQVQHHCLIAWCKHNMSHWNVCFEL